MKVIVAAEDDGTIRQILVEALGEATGWTVTAVPDGAELLEVVTGVRPDLVLLDVGLPGVDGIAVYHLLREREAMREVPVLFVTATPERVKRADPAGNFSILAKPFNIDTLIGRVADLLGEPKPDI